MTDIQALRAHLVAEVERTCMFALCQQRRAAEDAEGSMSRTSDNCTLAHMFAWQYDARDSAESARTATDAWLAADTRLRALDALIARCA